MKISRQLTAGVLAAGMMVLSASALETSRLDKGSQAANTLHSLGLFQGTGLLPDGSPSFELDRSALRGEALVMLIRLLGAEGEVLSGTYSHPFTDAGWTDAYCGYAYTHQIANGTSPTTFGTADPITQNQFLTFVLRALGYTDVDWSNPIPLAEQVGLHWSAAEDFYRCDMAQICLSALDCTVNGTDTTLRARLIAQGVISSGGAGGSIAQAEGYGPVTEGVDHLRVESLSELLPGLVKLVDGRMPAMWLEVPSGQENEYSEYIGTVSDAIMDVGRWSFSWYVGTSKLNIEPTYHDQIRVMAYLEGKSDSLSPRDQALLEKARLLRDTLIQPGMSEYEIVKTYHDYLVNQTTYQNAGPTSYDAGGVLLDGAGVCDGYSKALDLLCYLSNIDCVRVAGTAKGQGHAWNKVQVDGQWYNVDVTWDDPTSSRPVLRYDYFLVSDATLSQDHQWTPHPHWPQALADYN